MTPTEPAVILRAHINRTYERKDGVKDWQKLPEIPFSAEILEAVDQSQTKIHQGHKSEEALKDKREADLPHNIVDRPWASIGDYIGAQYQLLREDAIAPLRQAVSDYRSQPTMKNNQELSIYTHVRMVGMTFSNLGAAPRIEFSYEKAEKRIRWQQSKRLQQGTIIALSPIHDKFKSICKVAVVAARPLQGVEQNPPQIDLFWGDLRDADFDPLQEYVMIEARSGYFEASRHMLVALQKLITESFPLSDHLVHLNKSIGVPDFIKEHPRVDLNSLKPEQEDEDLPFDIDRFLLEGGDVLDDVDILGPWPKINGTSLDESQMTALRRIMTKQLAVVQGPPGTGKTFVSISALSVMLKNLRPGDPPIIVAAQTNHALDQLLNLIAPTEPKFLRLGGRTSEDNLVVKQRTLYEIRTKSQNVRASRGNIKSAKAALDASALEIQFDILKALRQGDGEAELLLEWKVITQDQFNSLDDDDWFIAEDPERPPGVLALWLGREQISDPPRCPLVNIEFEEEEEFEFEALEEAEAEVKKKDDDIDSLNGKWFAFSELYTGVPSIGYSDKKVQKMLETNNNLWKIPQMIRGQVYRYLRRQLKTKILEAFRGHMLDYQQNTRTMKVARWEADRLLIERSKIKLIGCTTTGLSKYRGLLASLEPRTMLIEEAAETLEGTVLAAMFESLQQLILVGDHQQLQAHCNVGALEKAPYNLAVSMFERLVNNGIEYTMLNKQRRMISDIRELLNPFYPDLQDHESVLDRTVNRKPVPGMGGRDSYFFHHQWPESRDDFLSRFNVHEANMLVAFFTYLVLNGVESSKITILTFYNGQRKILIQKLRKQPELAPYGAKFNVFTVDSYQGEENDVIILSLVRSNMQHNIGFLENKNRAVVSLSRARRGLYIFGNSVNLLAANAESFELWSTITDRLRVQERLDINSGLPIVCQNHGTETIVHEPLDWENLAGGCRVKCNGQLPCGHSCIYMCHPFSHEEILCKEPCSAILPCGHGCTEICGDPCRCACDAISAQQDLQAQVMDEMWQPSLDAVLGESPTKSSRSGKGLGKGVSNTPLTSASNSAGSSPQKWRQWNPIEADKKLQEIQEAIDKQNAMTAKSLPMLIDTHREVTVENGSRVKMDKAGTISGRGVAPAHGLLPSRQPATGSRTSGKLPGNVKAAPQKSQSINRFEAIRQNPTSNIPPTQMIEKSPSHIVLSKKEVTVSMHNNKEGDPTNIIFPGQMFRKNHTGTILSKQEVPISTYNDKEEYPKSKFPSSQTAMKNLSDSSLLEKEFTNLTHDDKEEDLISFD